MLRILHLKKRQRERKIRIDWQYNTPVTCYQLSHVIRRSKHVVISLSY